MDVLPLEPQQEGNEFIGDGYNEGFLQGIGYCESEGRVLAVGHGVQPVKEILVPYWY